MFYARRSFFCSDAKERTIRSFSASGVFNFTSLLLSSEDNVLYVGAREVLVALNLSDISAAKLQRNVRAEALNITVIHCIDIICYLDSWAI